MKTGTGFRSLVGRFWRDGLRKSEPVPDVGGGPGPAYPPTPWATFTKPTFTVADTYVPPGATQAHVRLTAQGEIQSDARLPIINVINGTGTNVGNAANQAAILPAYTPIWRPGDDADLWITLDLTLVGGMGTPGNFFSISFTIDQSGWAVGTAITRQIIVQEGAVNQLPAQMPYHRPPKRLVTGAPAATLDVATVPWSDTGYLGNAGSGTGVLRSRLSHGYSQPGNGEHGAYLNDDAFPAAALDPQQRLTDSEGRPMIRLHSERLPAPVTVPNDATSYYQQASIVTTQRLPEFNRSFGVWRARIRTPDRRGAWSAFWAIGGSWPPEHDVFEHFNAGTDFFAPGVRDMTSMAQHYGNYSSGVRVGHDGRYQDMTKLGFAAFDAYSEVHDYEIWIEPTLAYVFRDGVEVYCYRNLAVHQDPTVTDWAFYWLFNVAVKISAADGGPQGAYADGNGDLDLYGFWRFEQAQCSLVNFDDPRPWPSRKPFAIEPFLGAEGGVPFTRGAPAIQGTAAEGQTLSLTLPAFEKSPTSFGYSWLADGVEVGTGSTLALTSAHANKRIIGRVRGVNAQGPGPWAASPASGLVVGSGIAIRQVSFGQASTPGGTVTLEQAAQAGSRLLLYVSIDKASAPNTPAGWAAVAGVDHSAGPGASHRLFERVAAGGETSFSWTLATGNGLASRAALVELERAGTVQAGAQSVVNAGTNARASGTATLPASDTAQSVALAFWSNDSQSTTDTAAGFAFSGGFALIASRGIGSAEGLGSSSGIPALAVGLRGLGAAGEVAATEATYTGDSSDENVLGLVLIRPAT